jgi:hypothetical protein
VSGPSGGIVLDARQCDYRLHAHEAVQLAARWWDKTGRGMVNRKANEERAPDVRKGAGLNGAPAIVVKGSATRSVNSGILDGRKWDDLDAREKHAVVRAWVTIMRVKIRDPGEKTQ